MQTDPLALPNPFPSTNTSYYKEVLPFGEKNLFPQEISDMSRESVTLRAVLSSKANYVSGDSYQTAREEHRFFAAHISPEGYGLQELLYRLSYDYFLSGNCWVQVFKKGDEIWFSHIDQAKVRLKKPAAGKAAVEVLISSEWHKPRIKSMPVLSLPLYPQFTAEDAEGISSSCLQIRDYESGYDYYGLPVWMGAMYYVRMENLIGRFNYLEFENGFMPSGVLDIIDGGMSDEEAADFIKELRAHYFGTTSGNSRKMLIRVLEPGLDDRPTVNFTPMMRQLEGNYIDLAELCSDMIIRGCNWFRSLAGLATEGKLGSNQQIRSEYEIALKHIRKIRTRIMEQLNRPLRLTKYKEFSIEILNERPISLSQDIQAGEVLTINRQLELLGEKPLGEAYDKLLAEVNSKNCSHHSTKV